MLYLVIGKPKDGRILPPKKDFLELVVREWETVIGYKEAGTILDVFGFRDGNGGIIILEAGSGEEVGAMVRELPLFHYADWEIVPMMTAEEGLEKAKAMRRDRDHQ